jgi:hypothetical protein
MDAVLTSQIQKMGRKGTWQRVFANASVGVSAYRTDVNITGSGYLLYVTTFSPGQSSGGIPQIRITIDGNPSGTIGTSGGVYLYAFESSSGFRGGKLFVLDAQFSTSLKVETYNPDTSARSYNTEVAYILSA